MALVANSVLFPVTGRGPSLGLLAAHPSCSFGPVIGHQRLESALSPEALRTQIGPIDTNVHSFRTLAPCELKPSVQEQRTNALVLKPSQQI